MSNKKNIVIAIGVIVLLLIAAFLVLKRGGPELGGLLDDTDGLLEELGVGDGVNPSVEFDASGKGPDRSDVSELESIGNSFNSVVGGIDDNISDLGGTTLEPELGL